MRTDEEQIVWYRDLRTKAEAQLKLINDGWRFERGIAGGTRVDITDDIVDRERCTVETMDRLIEMYEARRS